MYIYKAKVIRVYDGDTIYLDIDLGFGICMKNQAIRLSGINTPEIKGSEKIEGFKIKEWLESKILNREIEIHTMKDKKGKFGRWLGKIFIHGENINERLAKMGYRHFY